MNIVHYIWIGGEEIPKQYLHNFQTCAKLNSNFYFNTWRNDDCLRLVEEYELIEVFAPLSFISKCNLLKYLVLTKFGGIYTDFDILWKQPFTRIINDFRFGYYDIILTSTNEGQLMDDPFIISKPGILGDCISYCKNRTDLKYDGELYLKTGEKKVHKLEPFGPFGLTEWLRNEKISFNHFPQEVLLNNKGFFGHHQQKSNWKL